jgi:YEATS domain-containing protein 4
MPVSQGSAGSLPASGSNISTAAGTGVGSTAATTAAASTAAETASTKRLPNTTASLPIVYGSIAFYLGKKADELQTHEWTLFLRGPNQYDDHLNSLVISKVVFQLHPSFAQPTRELMEPPYEVTERGWGEFEAQIRIHWKDPSEQTTIVNHTIKLYPQGTPPTAGSAKNDLVQQSTEKPVLAETYDEVVFTDPTESFFRSLTQITAVPPDAASEEITSFAHNHISETTKGDDRKSRSTANSKTPSSSSWKTHLDTVYSDREDFLALIAAQKFLQDELSGVKQRFQMINDELNVVDQKLLLAQQQKQREAAAAAIRGSGTSGASSGERKRTKKSRATLANKKPRTSGGSKGAGAGGSAATATGSGKRATASSAGGSRTSSVAKTGSKAASKSTASAATTATKKGNSSSGATA